MPEAAKHRPKFRNIHITQLAHYRLPLAGFVSILHRLSGLLIFLLVPFVLYLFDLSLKSEETFNYLSGFIQPVLIKLIVLMVVWAYLHHFCAGIRYLLTDIHLGLDKCAAKKSAVCVFLISIPLTASVALKLFGVI